MCLTMPCRTIWCKAHPFLAHAHVVHMLVVVPLLIRLFATQPTKNFDTSTFFVFTQSIYLHAAVNALQCGNVHRTPISFINENYTS